MNCSHSMIFTFIWFGIHSSSKKKVIEYSWGKDNQKIKTETKIQRVQICEKKSKTVQLRKSWKKFLPSNFTNEGVTVRSSEPVLLDLRFFFFFFAH